jgi:hypothetical protein
MSAPATAQPHVMPETHYLNASYGIRSWLLTTDHKRIALLYLFSVTFFFFVGGIFASLIRIHLLTPGGYLRVGKLSGSADGRRERFGVSET